jgi:hypothetical protein
MWLLITWLDPNTIFQKCVILNFTKPILKKHFINYTQNKVVHLPNNTIVNKNYTLNSFLLILND